ncbi:MAG TPA: hypothetical protein VNN80_15735 [Polyangiaceae bacterium]|nr:hypothetical protein [Polyangiaceae bacterium]
MAARSMLGALGLSAVIGCGGEDSTVLPPATPAGEDPVEAAGVTGSGPGPSELVVPSEYWEDGATVNGLSADVDDRFHGVTIDADDNVYAVGYLGNGVDANRVMVVAKYDGAGQPVAAFGSSGRVELDFSSYQGTPVSETVETADPSLEEARDVGLQSDGKLVVVGRAEDPSVLGPTVDTPIDILVFRLNADGTRDESFGQAGVVQLNPGGGINDLAWSLDIGADDRIYIFGHGTATNPADAETPRTDQDRYVWRLNPDGTPDTTFGVDGVYTFDTPEDEEGLGLNDNQRRGSVLPSGQIVTGGYTNVGGRNQIVLARLLSNGSPDTSFSADGVVRITPFATGMAECYGVALQSDGSMVTTGYGNLDVERTGGSELLDMVSFRVSPDGSPDPTWGVSGAVVYDPAGAEDRGRAVVALADDRILYAGAATVVPGNKDAMLLLVDADGAPAVEFDPALHKSYDFGGANEEFFSVKVSPSGRFVAAAGYAQGTGLPNGNAILAIVPILQ